MNTGTSVQMPRWQMMLGVVVSLSLAATAFSWFFSDAWNWWRSLSAREPLVVVGESANYMLGGGIFCMVVAAGLIFRLLGSVAISQRWEVIGPKLLIGSFVLTFALPMLGNPLIETYLEQRGYSECRAASTHKVRYARVAFVRSDVVCTPDLIEGQSR